MLIPAQLMMLPPLDTSALLLIVKDNKCLLNIIIIILSQDKHLNNVAIKHA
jgi:hypothetical protein